MTDAAFLDWLRQPSAYRCLLLEAGARVGGAETTVYLSNRGYVTRPADTPANTAYLPHIAGGISVRESLGFLGTPSMAHGDIELNNTDGKLDGYTGYTWTNRPVRAYLGDSRWPRSEFRLIFSGVADGLDSNDRRRLNLRLRDKLERLNTPVTEAKVGGSTQNQDVLVPVLLGEGHNITPVLVDPALAEFRVHDGPIERLIEVRDNGVPVQTTANLGAGTFRLNQAAIGQVTASVQGDKLGGSYVNDPGGVVTRLVTGYGRAADRFTAADLDDANLAAFRGSHLQPVGINASGLTVLEAATKVAASVGARLVMSRDGRLRLLKLALPPAGPATDITAANMIAESLRILSRPPVGAASKIAFCLNYTVQAELQTGLPPEHKALFAQEWLTATAGDPDVSRDHGITQEPEQEETLLLRRIHAQAEADRRLALRKVQRTVYEFVGFAELLMLELGQPVNLTHPRYGLSAGRAGQVVSLAPDWMTSRVTVGVLV